MPLRLIFMGTPDFAVPTLVELAGAGHAIEAVYTRAPKPKGRGMDLQDTPVAREAKRLGISVRTPATLKTPEAFEEFSALGADAAVVVAYGLILPKNILDAVPLGCFNLHASLLPRWRGAAPINRAIMAGDAESGVNIDTDWNGPPPESKCRGPAPYRLCAESGMLAGPGSAEGEHSCTTPKKSWHPSTRTPCTFCCCAARR